jgi:hypothetical protein
MKSLVRLYSPDEVTKFVNGLWQTGIFRESKYVADWVERFANRPTVVEAYPRGITEDHRSGWIFAEMSEPDLEYPHFGTWFGVTYLRHYDNKVISDLYYLHELVHAVSAWYNPNDSFTSWYRRVNTTEFTASLETEAYIYIDMPQLRKVSFDDQIWADRFLGANLCKDELRNLMRQERYRAIREPDPMDYCEQQISAYARQNFEWANIWKLNTTIGDVKLPAFKHVENHMFELRSNRISIDEHAEWLQSMGGDISFPDQARLFSDVYWRNKLGYRKG